MLKTKNKKSPTQLKQFNNNSKNTLSNVIVNLNNLTDKSNKENNEVYGNKQLLKNLTYCTNIHPGESWEEINKNLLNNIIPLKNKLNINNFGIGLRLSNRATTDLLKSNYLDVFKKCLNDNKLVVYTLNGFPYGDFSYNKIKDNVYKPDWTQSSRLD